MHGIAEKYVAYIAPRSGTVDKDFDKLSLDNDNGFLWDIVNPGSTELPKEELPRKESASEAGTLDDGFNS